MVISRFWNGEIEPRRAACFATVKIDGDVIEIQVRTGPVNRSGDVRDPEVPPSKRAAIQVKIQIGFFGTNRRDSAADTGERRCEKLVGLDGAGNVWANRASNHHGVGGADAIGQIDFPRVDIHTDPISAATLGSALELRAREPEKAVGKLEIRLESVCRFASEREIGEPDTCSDTGEVFAMPSAPDLRVDRRGLAKCEEIKRSLRVRLEQRPDNRRIDTASDAPIKILRTIV